MDHTRTWIRHDAGIGLWANKAVHQPATPQRVAFSCLFASNSLYFSCKTCESFEQPQQAMRAFNHAGSTA